MVFFTCNACGESVKKGQVEKHVNICKSCQYLSCIDCGKDFWGEEYKKHVKCISEDQKYGGKGYEVKTNKGDVKQQEWIQKIHEIMKKPSISPKLREILEKVSGFDNIPRKKAKFQNWMKNSLKIYNDSLQEQVWDIFSEATSNGPNTKEEKQPLNQVENQHSENNKSATTEVSEKTVGKSEGKKSKRERKEERQKNRKKEKKELKLENHQKNSSDQKSKKRKRDQVEEPDAKREEKSEISNTEKKKNKKKKKKEYAAGSEVNGNGNHVEMMTEEETKVSAEKRKRKHSEEEADSKKKKMKHTENTDLETLESETPIKGKFNWKGTIKAVLKQAPDNEIAVKKLRKKVLAQYYAVTNEHHRSEEELLVIFNKKINKNPSFKLLKEKVKLLK